MITYIFVFKKNSREFLEKKKRERELTNEIPGNSRSRNSLEDHYPNPISFLFTLCNKRSLKKYLENGL